MLSLHHRPVICLRVFHSEWLLIQLISTLGSTARMGEVCAVQIMKQFNVKGAAVGKLKGQLTDFQLAHPEATPEEARSFLAGLEQ